MSNWGASDCGGFQPNLDFSVNGILPLTLARYRPHASRNRVGYFVSASLVVLAAASNLARASETQSYAYDELGRLVAVTSSGTINNGQKHSICYDPAGNRTEYKSDSAGSGLACAGATSPSLSIADASVTEGGALVFTVTRAGDTSAAVSATYSTSPGTATTGSDFTSASGTVSFAAGQTSATISVSTIDDTVVESAETMSITLSTPTGGAVLGTATATGTINDNDAAPANLAIGSASATEAGSLIFTITRSGNTTNAVSASYATSGGTATSGSDFTAGSGTVSFAANQTTATITVPTIDDTTVETTESMSVTLSSPSSGAAITTATGTGTINDNDTAQPTYITISDAAALEGYVLQFTITRSGDTSGSTSINYATAPGTAATNDYIGVTGTLTFAPGETSKTISVTAKTDIRAENDEVFYVNLSGATGGAIVTDSQGAGTIYDDGAGGCHLC